MARRNRTSAKKAGTAFETLVARYLATTLEDDRIERRAKTGGKDRGDITGLKHMGQRVVVECKNVSRLNLASWVEQAIIEAGNDDANAGIVVHKRHGNNTPADQYVTCTLGEFVALITGSRDHLEENQPYT